MTTQTTQKPKRINNSSPAMPATVIRFSDHNDKAFELIKFDDQPTFQKWAALSLGTIRVVKKQADLKDVPTPVLLQIFNRSRADKPLDRFRDRETAETRVMDVVHDVTTPYEDSMMATAEKTEAKNKTEAKAADKAAKKAESQAAKEKAKAEKEAARKARSEGGVIGTIKAQLEHARGTTVDETLAKLTEKFPERTADGMKSTVKIQFSRLAKTTGRKIIHAEIVDRGRVYKFEDKGDIPGKRVVKEAPAAEAPKAETKDAKLKVEK